MEVNITPETPAEESEATWESALSELSQTLLSGFSSLRQEMEQGRSETNQVCSRLLEANASLTQQITQANQTLMERLTLQTPLPSPEIVIVPVEAPASEEVENPAAEISLVEEPPVATPRKRRTL